MLRIKDKKLGDKISLSLHKSNFVYAFSQRSNLCYYVQSFKFPTVENQFIGVIHFGWWLGQFIFICRLFGFL